MKTIQLARDLGSRRRSIRLGHLAAALAFASAAACSDGGPGEVPEPEEGGLLEGGGAEASPEAGADRSGDAIADRSLAIDRVDVDGSGGSGGAPGTGGSGGTDTGMGGADAGDASVDRGTGGAGGVVIDARPDQTAIEAGEAEAAVPDARIDAGADSSDRGPVRDAGPDIAPEPTVEAAPDVREASVVDQAADRTDTGPGTQSYLTIVAHPDDEIIFFNPDLEGFIRSGAPSTIVYITSGDLSETRGWPERELGVLDAHAAMAGGTSDCLNNQGNPSLCRWSCAGATINGKPVSRCTSADAPLTAIFLRLLDEFVGPLWGAPIPLDAAHPNPVGSVMQVADAGTTATYTKQDLIDVLAAIMNQVLPSQILTMDSTLAYNDSVIPNSTFDHPDHMGAGLFALAAAQAYHAYGAIRIYRGYTVQSAPANVSGSPLAEKERLMLIYSNNGSPNCGETNYSDWCMRQISYASVLRTGTIRNAGQCMQSGGSGGDVSINNCSGAPSQTWTVRADATIADSNGQCLTAGTPGSIPSTETCNGSLEQRWTWFEPTNGQLRGTAGSCLTNGATITTADCGRLNGNVPPNQAWIPN